MVMWKNKDAHGQSLVWSEPKTGIQGVTELEMCERTKGAWLRSVQNIFGKKSQSC